MRASIFITCLTDTLFPQTGQAMVAVLERLGVEVDSRVDRPVDHLGVENVGAYFPHRVTYHPTCMACGCWRSATAR